MSRRTALWILVHAFVFWPTWRAGAASPAGEALTAAAAGRGLIAVSRLDSAISWTANPALLDANVVSVLSVQHTRWYGFSELAAQSVSLCVPSVPIALTGTYFGGKLYRETALTFSTAWGSTDLRAGVAVRVGQTAIARYGSHHGMTLDLGVAYLFTPALMVSARGHNVLAWGSRVWAESLARSLAVSLGARLSTRAAVAAELAKDPLYPAESRVGLELKVLRALLLRAGVTVEPARTTLGLRFSLGRLLIDYAFVHHSVLGGTHFVGLTLLRSHPDRGRGGTPQHRVRGLHPLGAEDSDQRLRLPGGVGARATPLTIH